MQLCDFLNLMQTYFDYLIEVDSDTKRKNNIMRMSTFLGAFVDDTEDEEEKNPTYDKSESFLRKVYSGIELLPVECAEYYRSHLSSIAFENFINDVDDSAIANLVEDLKAYNEYLSVWNFAEEFTRLLDRILYNIINFTQAPSIRYAEFLGNSQVKIGDKTLNLPPLLVVQDDIQTMENHYIDALLEVYSQDSKIEIISIDHLKTLHPKYIKHFKMQRQYFYSAESVLHQIRDIFKDGEDEFNKLKEETYEGVESLLAVSHKNGLDRLDKVLIHVTILNYSRSYLGRNNNGLVGPNEKKGILHMLVNDGKIEWLVDYDANL